MNTSSLELRLPHPLSRRRACWGAPPPPTLWFEGEVTLACGRGFGGVPIPTRGHTLWCSTYKSTLWLKLSAGLSVHPVQVSLTCLHICPFSCLPYKIVFGLAFIPRSINLPSKKVKPRINCGIRGPLKHHLRSQAFQVSADITTYQTFKASYTCQFPVICSRYTLTICCMYLSHIFLQFHSTDILHFRLENPTVYQ